MSNSLASLVPGPSPNSFPVESLGQSSWAAHMCVYSECAADKENHTVCGPTQLTDPMCYRETLTTAVRDHVKSLNWGNRVKLKEK